MSEQAYRATAASTAARWRLDRRGEPLTCLAFDGALPGRCHENAAAYVTKHGGEVVRGFLVMHPDGWPMVWVMPHSVVRTETGLVDVTLPADQLRWLGFYPLLDAIDGFEKLAQRFTRESRSIAL